MTTGIIIVTFRGFSRLLPVFFQVGLGFFYAVLVVF